MLKIFGMMFVFLTFSVSVAQANVLIQCSNPSGKVFYPAEDRWVDDGISGGKFAVGLVDNEFDLLFVDATGNLNSASADGGTVYPVYLGADRFTLVVAYSDGNTELFSFDLLERTFYMTQHKMFNDVRFFHKFGTYKGKCD